MHDGALVCRRCCRKSPRRCRRPVIIIRYNKRVRTGSGADGDVLDSDSRTRRDRLCGARHGCIRRARARTLKLNSCAMMMEFAVLMSLRSVKWCMLAGADGAKQNRAKVSCQGRCRRRPPAEVRMCLCPFVTRGVFRDYRRWSCGGPGITLAVHTPGDIVLHWNRIRTGELGRMENVL